MKLCDLLNLKLSILRDAAQKDPGCSPAQTEWAEFKAPHDIRPLVEIDWKNNYVYDASLTLGRVFWWVIDNKVEQQHVHLIWTHYNDAGN